MILMPKRTRGQDSISDLTWAPDYRLLEALANGPLSDWAWEFLRLNTDFQAAALRAADRWPLLDGQRSDRRVYRAACQDLEAEVWGLCSFR
jgi:hypothetical protein